MLDPFVLGSLAITLVIGALAFRGAGHLVATRAGRLALLVAAGLLPLAASAGALSAGVHESSRTRFCLSCHEMQRYGRSLFADNPHALAAAHYQNRAIDRDSTCFSCHTNYALFGDAKAKLNGLRHVWVHYLGTIPERPKLYQAYPNANCLHCHDDGRRFVEAPPHQAVLADVQSGRRSCLSCHAIAHDFAAVDAGRLWQAGQPVQTQGPRR